MKNKKSGFCRIFLLGDEITDFFFPFGYNEAIKFQKEVNIWDFLML